MNRGDLFAMAIAAVLLRVALIFAASRLYHVPFTSLASHGDGKSYQAVARAISGQPQAASSFDRRVFPGYPLFIAMAHLTGVSWALAALGVNWTAAGIAAPLAALVCRDRRVGWAMVILTPHYLLYSSLAMSESLLLALCLAGQFAAARGRPLIGGLALGLGGIVRPVACFAVAGAIFSAARQRDWRKAALVAVASAAVVAVAALVIHQLTGDALSNLKTYRDDPRAYNGELFTYPFKSLLTTPQVMRVPLWKIAYIWAYVLATLAAMGVLAVRWWQKWHSGQPDTVESLMLPWLVGNTCLILCVGNIWGFQAFHRFSAWALPPMLFAFAPILPRRRATWCVVAAGSAAIALASIMRN
jgi:hypothetical protein